jgi:hypothetical protein
MEHFFTTFSTDSKSAFFDIFFDVKKLVLQTLKPNAHKTPQKIKKHIL